MGTNSLFSISLICCKFRDTQSSTLCMGFVMDLFFLILKLIWIVLCLFSVFIYSFRKLSYPIFFLISISIPLFYIYFFFVFSHFIFCKNCNFSVSSKSFNFDLEHLYYSVRYDYCFLSSSFHLYLIFTFYYRFYYFPFNTYWYVII